MQRVLLSESSGAVKFRVSKPGKDITSTNLDDYLIHESFINASPLAILNITSVPFLSVNTSSGVNIYKYTYPHGLPYTPAIILMSPFSSLTGTVNGVFKVAIVYPTAAGNQTAVISSISVDATNVYLYVYFNIYQASEAPGPSHPFIPTTAVQILLLSLAVQ